MTGQLTFSQDLKNKYQITNTRQTHDIWSIGISGMGFMCDLLADQQLVTRATLRWAILFRPFRIVVPTEFRLFVLQICQL